ncbi:MAG: MBL fold metallo-hydrolase, partial [Halieaceae bacterium]|nr:MBL fold metallo-hydrolase [Halieaceae bacterium]
DTLDAVVVSHAHLDHAGRLPMLAAAGYAGPVYMTQPTAELLEIMLRDAASLQERDAEWENKRLRRAGKEERPPLYTMDDAEAALELCRGVDYDAREEIAEGIHLRYLDAGHILGSAIVELSIEDGGDVRKLVFSGDLGNSQAALLRDPQTVEEADVLLLESTYGDREHRSMEDTLEEFADIIERATSGRGNVLIPSFAVGRSQEIIFRLGEFYQQGLLHNHAVFLDSPMAIAATEVYHRYQDVFNREDRAMLRQPQSGSLHRFLPTLRYSRSTAESMALNRVSEGAIIIAGSGMCNGGRIRHHFKHNLWRKGAHVVIVGFQARGTPGRALVDGARHLKVAGEDIAVRAEVHTLGGFSAHADQSQLLEWVGRFQRRPRIYLVHGEPEAKAALQAKLKDSGWQAEIAAGGQTISL